MKINPLGIQSYEQINKRENRAVQTSAENIKAGADSKVEITPQENISGSKLSIKAPESSFAEMLSPEERQALDLLFNKFKNSERFGAGFNRNSGAAANKMVGNVVDIKV